MKLSDLNVKIYADGADLPSMVKANENPLIKGFTTNPTLMRRAGITNYERFAKEALNVIDQKPISFEVFSDDFPEMLRQAVKIASWGNNVYVKIPIVNTRGESSLPLVRELGENGVCVNVTAIMGLWQVTETSRVLNRNVPSIISVFAGRVADTGIDSFMFMVEAKSKLRFANLPNAELLWASVREPLNLYQADWAKSDIITVPENILQKAVEMQGKELRDLSLETVKMFTRDAEASGYTL